MRIQEQVIRPIRVGLFSKEYWIEIFQYRDLFYMFCWREFKARYKQTALGIGWAVLQPFVMMVIFTLLLNGAAGMEAENGMPYPIYVYAGTLLWQIVSSSLSRGAVALVGQKSLLSKIYFPRIFIPITPITVALADFACASLILVGLYFYYGIVPEPGRLIYAPVFLLLAVLTVLAVVLWLSAINVDFRDVKHSIPFLAQLWMFITPVVYPISAIPEGWRFLYDLNPMVGIVQGMRWSLLPDASPPNLENFTIGFAVMFVLLITGLTYFQYRAQTVVDKA